MKIEVTKKELSILIKPDGDLTIYSAGELKQCLIADGSQYKEIEIDLSCITRLDSAGFQLLLAARCEAERAMKSIRFSNPAPEVLRLFTVYHENIEDWNIYAK